MQKDTKNRILNAAIRVFSRKGFKGATVREIVHEAGAHNLNSVVYYFGSKEELYKAVLQFMFEDAQKFLPEGSRPDPELMIPRDKLKEFIHTYLIIIYVIHTQLDADLVSIFAKELANPSPFLDEMVKHYIAPAIQELHWIIRGVIGESATYAIVRDCEGGIQLLGCGLTFCEF